MIIRTLYDDIRDAGYRLGSVVPLIDSSRDTAAALATYQRSRAAMILRHARRLGTRRSTQQNLRGALWDAYATGAYRTRRDAAARATTRGREAV